MLQTELMYETIREWPRYVKVPLPVAKVCMYIYSRKYLGYRITTWLVLESLQIIASPREILLNKVPCPLPVPEIFNLDQLNALSVDTVVSENGQCWKAHVVSSFFYPLVICLFCASKTSVLQLPYASAFFFPFWCTWQLWNLLIWELYHIRLKVTPLSFLSNIAKVGQISVQRSVKESLPMLTHKGGFSTIIFLLCYSCEVLGFTKTVDDRALLKAGNYHHWCHLSTIKIVQVPVRQTSMQSRCIIRKLFACMFVEVDLGHVKGYVGKKIKCIGFLSKKHVFCWMFYFV